MKNNLIFITFISVILSGCLSTSKSAVEETPETAEEQEPVLTVPAPERTEDLSLDSILIITQKNAQSPTSGGKVLETAAEMIEQEVIIIGACWDYINAVYDNAGFTLDKRKTVYSGSKNGPYADPALIEPGDWVYYKNLPYGEINHSAIFVEWIDFDRRSALTVEYIGRDRERPGWFREADLTKVYNIIRGAE